MQLAEARGFLRFCTFARQPAWCLTDRRRELYEFRQSGRCVLAGLQTLPERKSHCFGAGKRWPLGTREAERFDKCALVEGAPDFVALFNFLLSEEKEETVAPLAMLGAANEKIEAEAIELLSTKHGRLFPHLDEPGQRFKEPEGHNLVGDYHIQRGAIAVLAGAPGVGKRRAALWLAIQGARGEGDWFGLPVHCQFRTLMLQNENGLVRLHHDFEEIKLPAAFDSWLRVSSPHPSES
jgi:hypothetical protein